MPNDPRAPGDLLKLGDEVVRRHVLFAMGLGLIPIPILDFVAISAIQLDMLRQLCRLYGHSFSESEGKYWVTSLTGSYLARLGATAIKAIPGIGSLVGGVSMSVLSGAATYAIGKVFLRHFDAGGSPFDINLGKYREYYEEQFEKGKRVAEELRKRRREGRTDPSES
ncbi:MAG: DUF697 domain-containing protein [Candidatus Schekmanbacteria bacterium]|nr:DUF697 domain-containing protein [Candidatus Schekmanbacteria bacterium]